MPKGIQFERREMRIGVGERAIPRDEETTQWLQAHRSTTNTSPADPRVFAELQRQGFLTVENRWKLGCDEPYWISFQEVPGVAFPEEYFMLHPDQPALPEPSRGRPRGISCQGHGGFGGH